jgi:hypothetical protein
MLPPAVVGFTVTEALPLTLVFCVEVAVTVTRRLVVTTGAVSIPDDEMEPADVVQVTLVLKLPLPVTLAEHWLVPPELTAVGEQLTLTLVTVEFEDPPLPPQAAIQSTPVTTSNNPSLRAIIPPASEYRWPERLEA